jgi:hypothetical protein
VRRKALLRAAVKEWSLRPDGEHLDPAEGMLIALTVTEHRHAQMVALLQRDSHELEDDAEDAEVWARMVKQVVGTRRGIEIDDDGVPRSVVLGEFRRELVQAEAEERDRLMRFSKIGVDAQLEAKRLKISEHQAAAMTAVLARLLDTLESRGLLAQRDVAEGLADVVLHQVVLEASQPRMLEAT